MLGGTFTKGGLGREHLLPVGLEGRAAGLDEGNVQLVQREAALRREHDIPYLPSDRGGGFRSAALFTLREPFARTQVLF